MYDPRLSQTFEVSPDPEEFPDYYDAVQHPIDLETIRHRVQCLYYTTLHDFCRDVQQLVRNAKLFNAPRSEAYQDAELLRTCFDAKRAEMAERDRAREQALQLQLLLQQGGGDAAGRNKRRRLGSDDLGSVASSSAGAVGPGAEQQPEPQQPPQQQQLPAVAAAPSSSSSSSSAAAVAGGPRRASGGRGGRSSPRNRKDAMQGLACSCCAALEAGAGNGDGNGAGVLQGPLHLCKGCEERLAGNVLGARVEVLWPDDAVWYAGRVHDFDPVSGKHRVWYDDGEWEFVHLSEQEMRYLDPVPLAVPAAQAAAAAAPMEGVEALPGGGKEGEGSTA